MEWIAAFVLVAAILIVVTKVGHALVFGAGSPGVYVELKDALRRIQLAAAENVGGSLRDGELPGVSPTVADRQTASIRGVIRFVYTIDRDENGVSHVVASELLSKVPESLQHKSMLVVIVLLTRQLADAGYDAKQAGFDLDKAPSGTQFVTMHLTPEQHDALMQVELTTPEAS